MSLLSSTSKCRLKYKYSLIYFQLIFHLEANGIFRCNMSQEFCFLFTLLVTFCDLNVAQDLVVQLPQGKIQGHILRSDSGRPYYAFQDVPYAAPPVGKNRFQLAKEPEPWSGILNTTENRAFCYQFGLNSTEDCLFLNVYTPVMPGSSKSLPVLFWIHGGAFYGGTGAIEFFNPKYVMDEGIVIVTINYRLGFFGFLTTNDEVIPPNLGFKDQIFAMEWVNKNIELFGGNASMVTITGQSAGSMAIGKHLMGPWPNNKPLFQAAILESGSMLYFGRRNIQREVAFSIGKQVDSTFSSNSSTDLLKLLQDAPAEKIAAGWLLPFPVLEKSGGFSCQPMECLEKGNFKRVPIVIGFNSEEIVPRAGAEASMKQAAANLDKDVSSMFGSFNMSSVNKTIAGNRMRRIYTNTTFEDNIGAYVRYQSDMAEGTPITKQAELEAKYSDVYLYEFSYKGHLGGAWNIANITGMDKVGHSEELHYFWADETNMNLSKFPAEDKLTMNRFIRLWTNFVKYHNPTPNQDPLLQNITWTKVDPNTPESISYLNINSSLEVGSNPRYYGKVKKVMDDYVTSENII